MSESNGDKVTRNQIIGHLLQAALISIPLVGTIIWYSQQMTQLSAQASQMKEELTQLHQRMDRQETSQHSFELSVTSKLGEVAAAAKGTETNVDLLRRALKQ